MSRITPRAENFAQWYIDVVLTAKLADYSPIKGTMVIRPRGYALWEMMREELDAMFKETGHENAYFPLLIPESYLRREAEHVKGFAPETAVVTEAGGSKLDEPLVIRPTSETIIWSMYKKWIQSWRDLPILINQWANVVRWEKRTRLFLRTSEFLWQEGHTAHAAQTEAREEALTILEIYRRFAEDYLALPVLTGIKTESEKFAGAIETYSIESLMQDCKALQAGTSHFLGQNFARAFDVTFQNREGRLEHVWATSWGVSTRLIGALIMAHSDDKGLVAPPMVAPIEVAIVPIFKNETKRQVLEFANDLYRSLSPLFRIVLDDDDSNSPGWRFAEWELAGVPLRIECGPKDIAKASVMVVRRDTGEKLPTPLARVATRARELLRDIQSTLYQRAVDFRDEHSIETEDYTELKRSLERVSGFVYAPWQGSAEDERRIKEETKGTIRLLQFDDPARPLRRCIVTGKPTRQVALFARNY